MKNNLYRNFTYQLIPSKVEGHHAVEVQFDYREKRVSYFIFIANKFDKPIDEAKKRIQSEMKTHRFKRFAKAYPRYPTHLAIKIPLVTLASIVGVFAITIGGINLLKYAIWHEYFSVRQIICPNPGLNDGAVPQGITISQKEDLILTSAYMKDMKSPSRIYHIENKKEVAYTELMNNDDTPFTGHVGGLTLVNSTRTLYISNIDYKVYALNLDDVLNNKNIKVGEPIKTGDTTFGNAGDYIFSSLDQDEQYIYVGEFHNGNQYDRKNTIGKHHAAIYRYDRKTFSSDSIPDLIYSVPDKVQGFAITPAGRIMLSTSWALASSHYYVYEPELIAKAEKTVYHDVATIILDQSSRDVKAPPMAEDLAYKDGLFYNMNESASDKYIFGKFFNAWNIIGLKL